MITLTDQAMVAEQPAVPATPTIQVVESTEDYAKVVAEPLERGFGITLGNALRRVLLSSLRGAAVTWVRIEGVQHDYSAIPHVKEDVSELLLNVKGVRLRPLADRPGLLRLEVQGPGEVTAGDIQPSADFEIVNPELYLASLDSDKARLSMEFHVELGKGYAPAAHTDGMPIGVLPVDSIFTPVTKVNYTVERTRVGQLTNYDRLVLEVWTDGSKTPTEAVREAAQIMVDGFFQFVGVGQPVAAAAEGSPLARAILPEQYNMPLERLELSARTLNCLKRAKLNKVGEVLEKSDQELLGIKNFGEKSLVELKERLRALGLLPQPQEAEATEGEAAPAADVTGEPRPTAPAKREKERATKAKERIRDLAALRVLLGGESGEAASEGTASPQ